MSTYKNVRLDAHPSELAVVVKYQVESTDPDTRMKTNQKILNLKQLDSNVDISSLAELVMNSCAIIPKSSRRDLEQIIFFLQKRSTPSRSQSASSTSDMSLPGSASSIKASLEKVDMYIEMLYEDTSEKNRAAECILELAKNPVNVANLAQNETLVSAIARVLRDEWKKNLELATNILSVFCHFASYTQTQKIVSDQKLGALCISMLELELARGVDWVSKIRTADEKTMKKVHIALRKEHAMMAACVNVLLLLAEDFSVEMKMLRKNIIPLLAQCLHHSTQPSVSAVLATPVVQMLLKLSCMVENVVVMEKEQVAAKVVSLFPISDASLRKSAISLLLNLSMEATTRVGLVSAGMVQHVSPLIQEDENALSLLYQLSMSDDAKALLPFTDAIQKLMVDVMSPSPSTVAKACLLNACLNERCAQIAASAKGEGLDVLMKMCLDECDLLAAKILRNMASHHGPVDQLFTKWMGRMLRVSMEEGFSQEESRSARATELLAICAHCMRVDWIKLDEELSVVQWLHDTLKEQHGVEEQPFILQQIILSSRIAETSNGAARMVPLTGILLNLLHSVQEDDECVTQILFFLHCMMQHGRVAAQLVDDKQEGVPAYVMDLMHDGNGKIRELAEKVMRVICDMRPEWKARFLTDKFRYHNAQWLEMVEKDRVQYGEEEEDEEGYGGEYIYYDDDYIDEDEEGTTQLF